MLVNLRTLDSGMGDMRRANAVPTDDDFWKHLAPVEVKSSSLGLGGSGLKRQAPVDSHRFLLPAAQRQKFANQTDHSSCKVQPSSSAPIVSGIKLQASTDGPKFLPPSQRNKPSNQTDHTFSKAQSSRSIHHNPIPGSGSRPGVIQWQPPTERSQQPQTQPLAQLNELGNVTDYKFCKVCQVSCCGILNYKQHVKGKKHLLKLGELEKKDDSGKQREISHLQHWCEYCKIWCIDENSLKAHLINLRHKDVVAKLELGRQGSYGSDTSKQASWCELCDIWCQNEDLLFMHLKGKSHKAKLEKFSASKGDGEKAKQQHWCKLCNISCTDEDALATHFQGKKHILKLKRPEKQMLAWK
ncbi:hypothetical protein Tsubulata_015035 [Turnera subulata]|uniref:C2H2-type domain-containing protein n=1 Tax=Turnera subulata TaxID=218843 RepID=A0A9Q0F4C6_9ROSI|nr:hypothetical protein Tsubulata_015035 [Turnera subulata]